jgi:hypothetical protein
MTQEIFREFPVRAHGSTIRDQTECIYQPFFDLSGVHKRVVRGFGISLGNPPPFRILVL